MVIGSLVEPGRADAMVRVMAATSASDMAAKVSRARRRSASE